MITLYKRNAQGKPLVWSITKEARQTGVGTYDESLKIQYGLVGGNLHEERVVVTKSKVDELESRVKAKRKEGYKELSELKDSGISQEVFDSSNIHAKVQYLDSYLPKYSTTSEGFVLPMLAKVLEDNKPFEKYGTMLGQWKIDGLRCIIGAFRNSFDMFNPIQLSYHSRTGENWTAKMRWMDEIILPELSEELIEMMVEEGACLDGELYLPGYSVNDINSFVKNATLPQHYLLQYWCYDICCENMSALERNTFRIHNIDVEDKQMTYNEHLNNKSQLVILPTLIVDSIDKATIIRNNFIAFGFEGLILRNPSAEYQFGKRNQAMFKFKKVDDGKFVIVDIKSEHKRSDLPLFVLRNDINEELFECSINKPQDVQREILANKENYIGKFAIVEFRARSGVHQLPFHSRITEIKDK